jgi:hypothetical protein
VHGVVFGVLVEIDGWGFCLECMIMVFLMSLMWLGVGLHKQMWDLPYCWNTILNLAFQAVVVWNCEIKLSISVREVNVYS